MTDYPPVPSLRDLTERELYAEYDNPKNYKPNELHRIMRYSAEITRRENEKQKADNKRTNRVMIWLTIAIAAMTAVGMLFVILTFANN